MTTVAAEIAKQITPEEITKLIRSAFTSNASAFSESFKTLSYTGTKRSAFDTSFFKQVFINAVNSGAIDELVKTTITSSIEKAFQVKKDKLTAINAIRNASMSAFIKLTSKAHDPSNFWSELNALVKPATYIPLALDVESIIDALKAAPETDISFNISEKNIIDAIPKEALKNGVLSAFESAKTINNIDASVRSLHTKTTEAIIENAFSEAKGNTTEVADEFEDEFDEDENAMEFRIERLRKDIRAGLAKAFTSSIGGRVTHPSRAKYVDNISKDKNITEIVTREVFSALQTASGELHNETIKMITSMISDNVDNITKRYENIVIDVMKQFIIKGCTTNGEQWNPQQMECIREPLDKVIKDKSDILCESISSIIKRSICGTYGVAAIKKCLNGIKSMDSAKHANLVDCIKQSVHSGQNDAKDHLALIIDAICVTLKRIYNEAYKMSNDRMETLITVGVL